jgi:hypothetical protein
VSTVWSRGEMAPPADGHILIQIVESRRRRHRESIVLFVGLDVRGVHRVMVGLAKRHAHFAVLDLSPAPRELGTAFRLEGSGSQIGSPL